MEAIKETSEPASTIVTVIDGLKIKIMETTLKRLNLDVDLGTMGEKKQTMEKDMPSRFPSHATWCVMVD